MAIYCVTYDLKAPTRDYKDLYKVLRDYAYARPTESQWLLDTSETGAQIRDKLRRVMDSNDVLFVLTLAKGVSAANSDPAVWKWIEARL